MVGALMHGQGRRAVLKRLAGQTWATAHGSCRFRVRSCLGGSPLLGCIYAVTQGGTPAHTLLLAHSHTLPDVHHTLPIDKHCASCQQPHQTQHTHEPTILILDDPTILIRLSDTFRNQVLISVLHAWT